MSTLSASRRVLEPLKIARTNSNLEGRWPSSPSSPLRERRGGKLGSNPTSPVQIRLGEILAPFEEMRTGRSLETTPPNPDGFYRLGVELAQGSEGDVFSAVSVSKGIFLQIAVKRVRVSGSNHRRHVLNEVETAFRCRNSAGHENVVRYLDWFPGYDGIDREILFAMERCDFGLDDLFRGVVETRSMYEKGRRLRGSLVSGWPHRLSEGEFGKLLREMLAALVFLNSLGIIHQDVKAENILWKHTGSLQGVYKLCDFGVVNFAEPASNGRLTVLSSRGRPGTLWTQAPEVLRGQKHDASCDVWSLGCVLFEAVYLEKPFNSAILLAYRNDLNACLSDPFPPVRPKKKDGAAPVSPVRSPPVRRPVKSHSMGGFSPPTSPCDKSFRNHQRWIYSAGLKPLIALCLTTSPVKRPSPSELLEAEEYNTAIQAINASECKASITSTRYYKALLTEFQEKTSTLVISLYEGEDAEDDP